MRASAHDLGQMRVAEGPPIFNFYLKGPPEVNIKLNRRILNADSELPPPEVGLQCFPDK